VIDDLVAQHAAQLGLALLAMGAQCIEQRDVALRYMRPFELGQNDGRMRSWAWRV
jgi:hypothetical protein